MEVTCLLRRQKVDNIDHTATLDVEADTYKHLHKYNKNVGTINSVVLLMRKSAGHSKWQPSKVHCSPGSDVFVTFQQQVICTCHEVTFKSNNTNNNRHSGEWVIPPYPLQSKVTTSGNGGENPPRPRKKKKD